MSKLVQLLSITLLLFSALQNNAQCDLDVTLLEDNCGIITWQATNFPENATLFWEIDEVIILEGEDLLSNAFNSNGMHTICVFYETQECPNGVFWCEDIYVDFCVDGCPEEMYMGESGDCGCNIFEIGSFVEGESVFWNFGDGTLIEEGGHFAEHCFEENGEYQVYAIYSSPLCNGESYVFETIVVDCFEEECDLDVEIYISDCEYYVWDASNFQNGATLFWEIDEEIVQEGDSLFDWNFTTSGTHTICVFYETPECPDGVFWCNEFEVDLCNSGCPEAYGMDDTEDCGCYVFEIGSFVEGETVFWNFGDGNLIEEGGHFAEHCFEENGEYQVYAIYSSPTCSGESYVFETIVIDCFEEECDLDVEIYISDCEYYVWDASNFQNGATLFWEIDEEIVQEGDSLFDWSFTTSGTHTICVFYETPECPNGVFWCNEFEVDLCNSGCPEEIYMGEENDCGCYEFEIGSYVEGESVFWNFGDGNIIEEGGHFAEHCFEENGEYTIYAEYSSPECEGASYTLGVAVVDCYDEECDLDVEILMFDCEAYAWHATNFQDFSTLYWEIDEEVVFSGDSILYWDFTTEGFHTLCVYYETPECPNGVFWCDEFYVDLCVDGCPEEIYMGEENDCGCYEFEIGSFVEGESVFWNFGDETTIDNGGHFAEHCFEENGEYTIYAEYSSPECEGASYTLGVAVVDCFEEECTEVELGFDSFIEDGGPTMITWILEGEDGIIEGGTCQYSINVPYCDASVCLEDGCYTVSLWPDVPNFPEGFEFIANVDGEPLPMIGDPYVGNVVVQYAFSLNGDCEEIDCTLEIESDWQGDNSYVFESFASDSSATIWWEFGDGTEGQGSIIDHEFPGSGTYEVCAFYETENCPDGVWACTLITIEGDDCTEVTITVSANIGQNDLELIEWILESDSISFEGEFPLTAIDSEFTFTFCIPDGCYEMELEPYDGILDFIELEISILVDGILVADESMLEDDESILLEFGVNEDCTDNISIENMADNISIFPIPANESITIMTHNSQGSLEMNIYDITGQLILRKQLNNNTETISLQGFASGFYQVTIIGENITTKRIEVIR